MHRYLITLLLFITIAVGLSACGNKGPLTLPDDEDEKTKSTY